MNYKYIILVCIVLSGCNKKEILEGERYKIEGITYTELDKLSPELKSKIIRAPIPIEVSSITDISGSKQHLSINNKIKLETSETSARPKILWRKFLGKKSIISNIVACDGNLYVMNGNGYLFCVSQRTGKVLWKEFIVQQPIEGVFAGGITINNNIIYIGTNINTVIAFDIKTKKILWNKKLDGMLKGFPLYLNNKVIVTTINNRTYAFNSKTGKVLWIYVAETEDISMTLTGTPAVYKDNIICVYSSGDVVSINSNDGSSNWSEILIPKVMYSSSATIPHISASPIVIGDKVLVANANSQIALLDANSGVKLWDKSIGSVFQPVIFDKDWVFVLSDKDVLCMSLHNGGLKWRANLKEIFKNNKRYKECVWYGPILINGQIWVFGENADIIKIDISTGQIIDEQYIHHVRHRDTPIVLNGTLYTSVGGSIYALG